MTPELILSARAVIGRSTPSERLLFIYLFVL